MAWLAHHGWTTVGSAEVEDFYAGRPLPKKSVVVTFDDGYLDNYLHAHPVLAEFGQKALLFVVTGWMGAGPVRMQGDCPNHKRCKALIAGGEADAVILRWAEVEAMQAAGTFEFHSHTDTHTRWDKQLPPGTARLDAMAAELSRSAEVLGRRLGRRCRHLCWPQGYYEADYLPLARQNGYTHLYTTEARSNKMSDDPARIGRVVTKEKSGGWLGRRLAIYTTPLLADLYARRKAVP
jgi:peptidoglycan/xylan/chitin deacetylase (PgdA/CDA1 family)